MPAGQLVAIAGLATHIVKCATLASSRACRPLRLLTLPQVVFGASERFAIPYDDPKASDGADRESRIYDERCREIACEMLFLFSRISAE